MSTVNRILIFSGGNLGEWALKEIKNGDFILGVDRGALFLLKNGITPHFALGDFDSVTSEEYKYILEKSSGIYSCDPIDKDYTDTEMAFRWAMKKQPEEIVLLGVTGSRLDHTLANVHLLYEGLNNGIQCKIIDKCNQIILTDKSLTISKNELPYVSLLPFSFEVTGITLLGFKYPLNNATLRIGQSLGVSNVLVKDVGRINIESGELLIIRSVD